MTTVADIEHAIEQLSPEELKTLRAWFAERDAIEWDRQFEADVEAERLDALAEEAIREEQQARCTEL
jgi:hypothetical protein